MEKKLKQLVMTNPKSDEAKIKFTTCCSIVLMCYNVRRYISVADYEARNYQNSNNLNTRENDKRNTKTAIEYTCC